MINLLTNVISWVIALHEQTYGNHDDTIIWYQRLGCYILILLFVNHKLYQLGKSIY